MYYRVAAFDPVDPTRDLGLPRGAQLDREQAPSEILDQLLTVDFRERERPLVEVPCRFGHGGNVAAERSAREQVLLRAESKRVAHSSRVSGMQRGDDLFRLEDSVWLWTRTIGVPIYDFAFDRFFACRRGPLPTTEVEVVARVGAFDDYAHTYAELLSQGLRLVNSPEQHLRATRLPRWYPLLEGLTPKSMWFSAPPEPEVIEAELGWPVFMKGERQTSRHKRSLSIIAGPQQLREALKSYAEDPRLCWQDIVCRRLAPLRPVEDPDPERIPSSFEFRSFWWRGELAGIGRYWWQGRDYSLSRSEERLAVAMAREAARRVDVPFLVVDVAQQIDGTWIVVECNDGQESGYAGASPFAMWQAVADLENLETRRSAPDPIV